MVKKASIASLSSVSRYSFRIKRNSKSITAGVDLDIHIICQGLCVFSKELLNMVTKNISSSHITILHIKTSGKWFCISQNGTTTASIAGYVNASKEANIECRPGDL